MKMTRDLDMHIRISKEEMEALGGKSLELTDGSGYVGSLEVYHDLHCLVFLMFCSWEIYLTLKQKHIRHFIYQDTYFPNLTQNEYDFQLFHTGSCPIQAMIKIPDR